jgi:hypothetical protein
MACAAPAVEAPPAPPLGLDRLYAAYAAAHLSVDWAELVLDHVADCRDELLDLYSEPDFDEDERAQAVLAWVRTLPDRP